MLPLVWHGGCAPALKMRQRIQAAVSQRQWDGWDGSVSSAVVEYLRRHPSAADSLIGICGWWLPSLGVEETPDRVEPVLEQMVAAGRLERRVTADGTVHYRAAAAATDQQRGRD